MLNQIEKMEPVGIVISQGIQPARTQAVLSYVWGPAPELDLESDRAITRAA